MVNYNLPGVKKPLKLNGTGAGRDLYGQDQDLE